MKRFVLIIGMLVALFVGNVSPALADAISYDMKPANYYVYVMTPDGGLNFRYGPGVEYDKVIEGRIPDYTKLYIEYTSDNWGYTNYEGNYGWVALKQTTTTPPAQQNPTVEPTVRPTVKPTEIVVTDVPTEVAEPAETETHEAEASEADASAKMAMTKDILLIAVLVLLIVVVAVLLVIIINMNSKKNRRQ